MPEESLGGALLVVGLGVIGLLWTAWMRWGPAHTRSWWVRRSGDVARSRVRSVDTEDFALVVVPMLSLTVVGGGMLMLPVVPDILLVAASVTLWACALVLLGAVLVSTVFLPMWVYPRWLRDVRRRERDARRASRTSP